MIEEVLQRVCTDSGPVGGTNNTDRSDQLTQLLDLTCAAVRRYWDEHGRHAFDTRMRGIDPWPALPGSDDRNAHQDNARCGGGRSA